MAPAILENLKLIILLYLSHEVCHGAVTCKESTQIDLRYPKQTVMKCLVEKNEDFNRMPLDAGGLWLHFPKGNNISLAPDVLRDMVQLEYLKIDITFINPFPVGIFENVYLPNLKTVMLVRDLNAVDTTKNIAITVKNNTFNGLNKLENLYLDNLGIQILHANAFYGLESLQILDLTLNYLNKIPSNIFIHCKNLTTLKLSDNFISMIELNSFKGLTQLESLDISLNKLKKLTGGTFLHLQHLKLLVATSNQIQTIQPNAFSSLSKLHYLSLARNNLTKIDPMVFKGLNSLDTLILDHNKIQLKMGQFAQASHLLHLYLANNDIKNIDSDHLEGLLSITELILSSNKIPTLKSEVFYSLPTLITLDISNNMIDLVEENAFQGLTNLQTLNLKENKIQSMPPGSFDDLTLIKTIYMDQNPWVCNCDVEWLILWLRSRINQIEPNVQFYYILCSENDPIRDETFFALIMSEHFLNDLKCGGTTISGDSTEVSVASVKDNTATSNTDTSKTSASSSTTDNTIITEFNGKMSKTQKIIIIVFSVLGAVILVLAILIHLYCRKHKRTWDPSQKPKTKGNDMIGHKKVPISSSADPEAGYLGIILKKYTPNIDQHDLVKPAYPRNQTDDEDDDETVYYVYQNHALSTSLEYIQRCTDINHSKRGDLSDNDESPSQFNYNTQKKNYQKPKKKKNKNHQTVVQMEPIPSHINVNHSNKKPQKQKVPLITDASHDFKFSFSNTNIGSANESSLLPNNNPNKSNSNNKKQIVNTSNKSDYRPTKLPENIKHLPNKSSKLPEDMKQFPNSLSVEKLERRDSVISEDSESIMDGTKLTRDTTVDSAIDSPTDDQVSQCKNSKNGQCISQKNDNKIKCF